MFARLPLLTAAALALFLSSAVLLTPNEANAQVSVEVRGKVGISSATIDNTNHGDPAFDVAGGAQFAAMLRFATGIAAGFNFNWFYEPHMMRNASSSTPAKTMSFNSPSFGIIAKYRLQPNVDAGGWANYVFGSATVDYDASGTDAEWDIQGFEIGGELKLTYQLKPYKTYILAGVYAYMQYLNGYIATPGTGNYGDMATQNVGAGALLGVRWDFKI